ncbi:MAG TPA: T9SS type A sorting domain-containing protein [Flavobacteriales bacterium]|nr:T9SS type A sorting domain-containing protein [Flavobacteriales bacterium]
MKKQATLFLAMLFSVVVVAQTTPAICIATVDPGTNYNMIGWDKVAFPASSYNIYQETSSGSGVYNVIGNTPTGSLSVYFDISSDPDVGSSSYKITTIDGGGVESAQSAAFSTMFLTVALSGASVSMFWSAPGGFVPVQYDIWRGATSSTMTLIDSMSGSLTSYFDISPPLGTVCYRIEAPNPAGCVPTAPPTDYSSSFSNTACTTILSAADPDQSRLVVDVTPNPFSSTAIFTIDGTSQSVDLELFNMIGKKVHGLYGIPASRFELSRENLPDGIYLYRISSDSGLLKTGKVIVN